MGVDFKSSMSSRFIAIEILVVSPKFEAAFVHLFSESICHRRQAFGKNAAGRERELREFLGSLQEKSMNAKQKEEIKEEVEWAIMMVRLWSAVGSEFHSGGSSFGWDSISKTWKL